MIPKTDLDLQCIVSDVRRDAFQLQCLEDGPVEKSLVCAAEFAQVFDEVLVSCDDGCVLFRSGLDGQGVLADCLVMRPVALLAVRGAILWNVEKFVRECWGKCIMYTSVERGGREASRSGIGGEIIRLQGVGYIPA